MKIAIHQPNYLPYPGFFAKASLSDIFVLYDIAQFTRGDFHNRNRIRTFSFNGSMWLSLPVGKRDFSGTAINQVRIVDGSAFVKHSQTLKAIYSKARFFDEEICELVATPHENLSEHNILIIKFLLQKLKIKIPRIVLSSELGIKVEHANQGIIDILKALDGDEYISGIGAKSYVDEESFKKEQITLSFLDYKPLRYPQIHPGFVENMSIIDAVYNIGWEDAASKLRQATSLDDQR